jgi:hypothetical protein
MRLREYDVFSPPAATTETDFCIFFAPWETLLEKTRLWRYVAVIAAGHLE